MMIVKLPSTTKELWEQLEAATQKMSQEDRNAFTLDLVKFCVDWQFMLLAMKASNN